MRKLVIALALATLSSCSPAIAQEPPKGKCVSPDLMIEEAHKDGAKAAAFTPKATRDFVALLAGDPLSDSVSYIVAFTKEDIPTVLIVGFDGTNCAVDHAIMTRSTYDKLLVKVQGAPA
jgi:hypothetical protein